MGDVGARGSPRLRWQAAAARSCDPAPFPCLHRWSLLSTRPERDKAVRSNASSTPITPEGNPSAQCSGIRPGRSAGPAVRRPQAIGPVTPGQSHDGRASPGMLVGKPARGQHGSHGALRVRSLPGRQLWERLRSPPQMFAVRAQPVPGAIPQSGLSALTGTFLPGSLSWRREFRWMQPGSDAPHVYAHLSQCLPPAE